MEAEAMSGDQLCDALESSSSESESEEVGYYNTT